MENMLKQELFITVSHCGANGVMTADRLLEFFQDMASRHGEGLGVGLDSMTARNRFWLTVRSRVRIFRAPRLGETGTVYAILRPDGTPALLGKLVTDRD